jgi:ATP-dependent RNA helicase DbpA
MNPAHLRRSARASVVPYGSFGHSPPVESSFKDLKLSPSLLSVLEELGYETPTPIQLGAIPAMLGGRDFIGQSKTGSGKTAAFALPILQNLSIERPALQALVLCPTRELCAQVARETRKLGRAQGGLRVLELVGGQPSRPQREALERGVHFAVGTPGRLLDHLQREFMDPRTIRTVVLDEADRMLDMGFGDDVNEILHYLPPGGQTALFSATFPESIQKICDSFLNSPERVTIAAPAEEFGDIRQLQFPVDKDRRLDALAQVLASFPHDSALVFCNFKATVADLVHKLGSHGISADRLDGDLDQFHRDQVLARFRNGSLRILVATDVAGRGLDVKGLDLVVNFELPPQPETYVHRIGRTGRAGSQGVAISLTRGGGDERMEAAERLVGSEVQVLTPAELQDRGLHANLDSLAGEATMSTILISGGRKDKVRPGDLLGALTGDAGSLSGKQVGKIEVQEKLSYVAVACDVGREAVRRLNAGRIKGKRFRATLVG